MTELTRAADGVHHTVTFYEADADLISDLGRYVAEGLAQGERIIVIATRGHRDGLDDVLIQHGVDPSQARRAGRYLTLDAAETLARFLSDGAPDRQRFFDVVGAVVDAASADGCSVRAFGEMVALLWQDGNVAGALELEALWNELLASRRCMLLCAYPAPMLSAATLAHAHRVCQLHADIEAPRGYATRFAPDPRGHRSPRQASEVLLPVSGAVLAARRFAAETLRGWGLDRHVADAALIASELATNAVIHARSPFQLRIDRDESRIRLTLEDADLRRPEIRDPVPDALGGRGVAIVDKLSSRWGCDVMADRKAVWAEMSLGQVLKVI